MKDNPQPLNTKGLLIALGILGLAIFAIFRFGSQQAETDDMAGLTPEARGQAYFERYCGACHGMNAEGKPGTPGVPALNRASQVMRLTDGEMQRLVMDRGLNMPAYGNQFTTAEVADIIRYLHTLWTAEQLADQQARSANDPLR